MDYDKVPGKPQCCGSCHDDAEQGYYTDMIELYLDPNDGNLLTHRVCCTVGEWISREGTVSFSNDAGANHGE